MVDYQPENEIANKKWWSELELNQRHKPFQGSALPTELPDHWQCFFTKKFINQLKYLKFYKSCKKKIKIN